MQSPPALVDVYSSDLRWRAALVGALQRMEGVVARPSPDARSLMSAGIGAVYRNGNSPKPGIVVAPVRDMPPELCGAFAVAGVRVIVLAAVPRMREEEEYLAAGAYAYLQMEIGNRELIEHIAAMSAAMPDDGDR